MMGLALIVLELWSIVSTPRVIRRFPNPRVWMWWACWLVCGSMFALGALRQGLEEFR